MTGLVLSGSMNRFVVRMDDGRAIECGLKGKVLKGAEGFYNPLAPGDRVEFEWDEASGGPGQVTACVPRRNSYARWNRKGRAPQLLAANLDLLLAVSSPASPPFRPRFLDRVLLQADVAGIAPVIVMNKCDLADGDIDTDERLEDFKRLGYLVVAVSAATGEGLEALRGLIAGKTAALVGQSGVGKSSLVNALEPESDLAVGELCAKFDRGSHTTTMARLLRVPAPAGGAWIIDTPGVRQLAPEGTSAGDLAYHLREFAPLIGRCSYGLSCSHRTEVGCKILEAIAAGVIHEDRYESFLRMRDELNERVPEWERD